MTQQINTGSAPNDGTGDTLRAAFLKVNANTTEIDGDIAGLESDLAGLTLSAGSAVSALQAADVAIDGRLDTLENTSGTQATDIAAAQSTANSASSAASAAQSTANSAASAAAGAQSTADAAVSAIPSAANPSASVGASAVNGAATTFMRSDAAPPLANTAVTPGSYTHGSFTVDQQGRLTAASSGAAPPAAANPSGSIGMAAVNGAATTFMRSDAHPAIDPAIAPAWTGVHRWNLAEPRLIFQETDAAANKGLWDWDLNGSIFALRTRTDADGAGQNAIAVTRGTTTSLTNIVLGNATLGSTLTLDFGGGSLISDTDFFFLTGQLSCETTISSIEFISATLIDFQAAETINFTAGGDVNVTAGGADGDINLNVAGTGTITLGTQLGNFANDAAAAAGGIPVRGLYRNGSVVMVRVA